MKKTLIALAVAGVVAAPAAFAATSNVDIYGVMSFSVDRANTDDSTIDDTDYVTGRDNVSRIGFKGSEDLGGGLSAIWQIENQLNVGGTANCTALPCATSTSMASRNTFVGLKGGFGTVMLGQHDTPYKLATSRLDPFVDTVGDYNMVMGRSSTVAASSLFDVRASQVMVYMSPEFSGLSFAAAAMQSKTIEALNADDQKGYSLSGTYANGPLFATAAYEKHSGILGASAVDSVSAWKVGAGYSFGNAKIGAMYEKISGGDTNAAVVGGEPNDRKALYLSGQYNMGAIALKAAYGKAGDSNTLGVGDDDGAKFYAIGADYSLSKRTTAYAVYTQLKNDGTAVAGAGYDLTPYTSAALGNDPSVLSVGVKHSF